MRRFDTIVLGAGIVGLSTALQLQERGRSVLLLDRRGPMEETSFGNAALIQAEAAIPYAFPRDHGVILGVLLGRRTDARLVWRDLPWTARGLLAYAAHSGPEATARTARANVPLLARAVPEHRRLLERAGALHLVKRGGYLLLCRTDAALERTARAEAKAAADWGVVSAVWDGARLAAEEPHLEPLPGAIHFPEPERVEDPGDVGLAYARLFAAEGGTVERGDAGSLRREAAGWSVRTEAGETLAREAVVALGPWSGDLLARLGIRVPLFVKRGYHQHFRPAGNAVLHHTAVDGEFGFVLAPNKRGIRVTTGAEFARRDRAPTPVQLRRVEPIARRLFPLDGAVGPAWMGARPCLPDLLPMIGPVPGRPGLFANFGHQHLGLTLGPATGRLLAEIVSGEMPFTDPAPYRVERF